MLLGAEGRMQKQQHKHALELALNTNDQRDKITLCCTQITEENQVYVRKKERGYKQIQGC